MRNALSACQKVKRLWLAPIFTKYQSVVGSVMSAGIRFMERVTTLKHKRGHSL